MEGDEKLWWTRCRLGEQTERKQCPITGTGGYLLVKVDDGCLAACYSAMVRHQKTGRYHVDTKGYLRTFSGCCNGTRLEQLSEEVNGLVTLVKELETARLNMNGEELQELIRELEQPDKAAEGEEREA